MNHKNKATKHPDADEAPHTPLDGLVSNLSSGLTRMGSAFKGLFNPHRGPTERADAGEPTARIGSNANAAPARTSLATARPAPPPSPALNSEATTDDPLQLLADDHAWISQNLAHHLRGRPAMPPSESIPGAEPMDEAAIRARLLKIHGGRLPGRAGRHLTSAPPDALRSEASPATVSPRPVQTAQPHPVATASVAPPAAPPARPATAQKRTPPVISSKPRASVVKPAPANLRKPTPPAEVSAVTPLAPIQAPPAVVESEPLIHYPDVSDEMIETIDVSLPALLDEERLETAPDSVPYLASPPPSFEPTECQAPLRPAPHHDFRQPLPVGRPAEVAPVAPSPLRAPPAARPRRPISASISAPVPPASTTWRAAPHPEPILPAVIPPEAAVEIAEERTPSPLSTPVPAIPAAIDEWDAALTSEPEPLPPAVAETHPAPATPPVKPRIVLRPTLSVAQPDRDDASEPDPMIVPDWSARDLLTDDPATTAAFSPRDWAHYAPPLSLLQAASDMTTPVDHAALDQNGRLIEEKLGEFRVKVVVRDAYAGPVITRYEVEPAVGVRGAQVVNLMKDLARALGVTSIRVVETIPGKTYMGLELPNARRQMIRLSEVLSSEVFQHHPSKLAMALGKDITGEPIVADLAKAPHMLVAGTTGSGKSVGVNAMILSLLYRATPDEVRFVMIDPKMLELSVYDGIPHLLAPVVTDMKLAANALNWCVTEMERRYRLMSMLGVRNLSGFNQKIREATAAGRSIYDPEPLIPESPTPLTTLPFIVVVVDEFADLMMVAGKKIEELIARLAQKARAAGIHLILATQRPSVDVITGLIKANIPTRIAFQVSSKVDSRTILDQMGAETLLGQGDMLYLPPGTGYPQRVHGAFVADDEVHALAEHLKQYGEPDYIDAVLGSVEAGDTEGGGSNNVEESDPLYDQAVAVVIESRRASISLVQRHLRIGYNRAARLVEQMEVAGIVSPMESNGSRTVLAPSH